MNSSDSHYSQTLLQCWRDLGIAPELISQRGLPAFAQPESLTTAEISSDGREHLLIPEAVHAWQAMKAAAAAQQVDIHIVSAYRSIRRQIEIIERKLSAGQTHEQILAVSAPPGCSEHHSGRAVDIGTAGSAPLETEFESTPAFRWLSDNAQAYGFRLSYPPDNRWGYSYEPWHWCYHASANSQASDQ